MMTTNTNNHEVLAQFENLTQILILNRILCLCSTTMVWVHNGLSRGAICKVLGISEINFKKNITKMKEKGILLHVSRGRYQVNNNIITTYDNQPN